jgi:tetratricopeptide (TPR) repeat protein
MDPACKKAADEEIIEHYLTGRLSLEEAEAFEQHLLECQRCFSELQWRHAAGIELRRQAARPAVSSWRTIKYGWRFATAAAAVMILMAALVYLFFLSRGVKPDSEAVIDQLASLGQPPLYLPSTIRGAKSQPALELFAKGMREYANQKYQDAVPLLESAARLDPDHLPTAFYLGISYLILDQPDAGIPWLVKVVRADPNPYAEESHWFLSKAYFKKGNLDEAGRELEAVVKLEGSYAPPAQNALEKMKTLRDVPK